MMNEKSLFYLIVGHVTQDLLPDGEFTVGGTATYSGRTALALGNRVAVVTSIAPDLDVDAILDGCEVLRVPSETTTTFKNVYTPAGREQFLYATSAYLDPGAVPPRWRQPDIVHLAPLTSGCDYALARAFPGALVAATPQGWMRDRDHTGRVQVSDWPDAEQLLPYLDAAVISEADVGGDQAAIQRMARLTRILAVTLGPEGCLVYVEGRAQHVPVAPQDEVDPTGAGDIFAAAFFTRLRQSGDPLAAARFANAVAALSVVRAGWASTPTREEILQSVG
jgi:sugar/nucleoside kinase (ribokinase family)